jgi:hypothetical protein
MAHPTTLAAEPECGRSARPSSSTLPTTLFRRRHISATVALPSSPARSHTCSLVAIDIAHHLIMPHACRPPTAVRPHQRGPGTTSREGARRPPAAPRARHTDWPRATDRWTASHWPRRRQDSPPRARRRKDVRVRLARGLRRLARRVHPVAVAPLGIIARVAVTLVVEGATPYVVTKM